MTSQPSGDRSHPLEARVTILEKELTQVKQTLSQVLPKTNPWWIEVAGSFEDDPTFDEAVRLGQEWRRSAE